MKRAAITKAQIKMIHTIRGYAVDEDTYRDYLFNRFGYTSTTQLSKQQAIQVINMLKGENAASKKYCKGRPHGYQPEKKGYISNKQLVMLIDILRQCGKTGTDAVKWVMKVLKNAQEPCTIFDLSQLKIHEATKVIPIARKMYKAMFGVDHKPGVVLERRV